MGRRETRERRGGWEVWMGKVSSPFLLRGYRNGTLVSLPFCILGRISRNGCYSRPAAISPYVNRSPFASRQRRRCKTRDESKCLDAPGERTPVRCFYATGPFNARERHIGQNNAVQNE